MKLLGIPDVPAAERECRMDCGNDAFVNEEKARLYRSGLTVGCYVAKTFECLAAYCFYLGNMLDVWNTSF